MASKTLNEADKMAVFMPIKMTPELKQLIEDAANAEGMSQVGWIINVLAEKLERPDLAFVPRKKSDRPRSAVPA